MARKPKKTEPKQTSAGVARPSSDDVRRAVAEVQRQKASAAEYTGYAGQETKRFCDKWNVSKIAFGFVRKLADMDPQKRQSVLIDAADMCKAMGFTDQADLFVDVGAAVDGMAGGGSPNDGGGDAGPTEEDIAARTDADLAEGAPFVDKTHAERMAEIGAAVGGPH